MTYDSRPDTYAHIAQVRGLLLVVVRDLLERAHVHDESKLESPEREMFDEFTPRLAEMVYGSPEYEACTAEMRKTALRHHYEANRHHPEHFPEGITGMNLLDLTEMLADWKAAGLRHADGGDLGRSITINAERFGYGPEIERLLRNTAEALSWL